LLYQLSYIGFAGSSAICKRPKELS